MCTYKTFHLSNLKRHILIKHESSNLRKHESSKELTCDKCTYKTVHHSTLKRHILRKHESSKEPSAQIFKCSMCSAKYKCKYHLRYHERKYHQIGKPSFVFKRVCPICKFTVCGQNRENIYKHYENEHAICMKSEQHNFDSINEFNAWKQVVEKKTRVYFVKRKSQSNVSIYQCHRNCFYKKKGS